MRKLNTTDVFGAVRLVAKSGIKEKLIPLIKEISESGMSEEDAGITGILTFMEVLSDEKCEQLIYKWLAGPFEKDPEAIAVLPLDELTPSLQALVEENDLRNFFTVLYKLISKKR